MLDIREMELNMGPQHPSTHGVLRLILYLDGETVVDCKPVMGYLHRGTEKLCETRDYYQNVPFTDRTDYIAAPYMNLGYVEAVEKLAGWEVGMDPSESNFGKIKIGHTRVDIFACYQQPIRLAMKFGVSLQVTMPLPRCRLQNSVITSMTA